MHEHSLMKGLMVQISALAEKEGARRIHSVNIWLGAMSHMSPEHFKEHFDEIAKGGIAEAAILNIETSDDIHNQNAQDVILQSVEIALS